MALVQLALNVADIDRAVDFYAKLFATGPAKVRPGYANFVVADPPLKLVLIENRAAAPGSLNHLGVEVPDRKAVAAAASRLRASGLSTTVEAGITCCHAVQDKVWAMGPDTDAWEIYAVIADAEVGMAQGLWGPGTIGRPVLRRPTRAHSRATAVALPLNVPLKEVDGPPLPRRLLAEFVGSAFLAAVVIGSGIAAHDQSPGNPGLQLLENAAATSAGLFALISAFGPISGGHLNPVVSFVDARFGGISWRDATAYLVAQTAGCASGAVLANLMFGLDAVTIATRHRATGPHFLSEVVATLGLLVLIFALARSGRSRTAPAAVGAYIGAAYWFTSSTSFANPAITVGRMLSNSFAGIAPSSAPWFIGAQLVGALAAVVLLRGLFPDVGRAAAAAVVVPHLGDVGSGAQAADPT